MFTCLWRMACLPVIAFNFRQHDEFFPPTQATTLDFSDCSDFSDMDGTSCHLQAKESTPGQFPGDEFWDSDSDDSTSKSRDGHACPVKRLSDCSDCIADRSDIDDITGDLQAEGRAPELSFDDEFWDSDSKDSDCELRDEHECSVDRQNWEEESEDELDDIAGPSIFHADDSVHDIEGK